MLTVLVTFAYICVLCLCVLGFRTNVSQFAKSAGGHSTGFCKRMLYNKIMCSYLCVCFEADEFNFITERSAVEAEKQKINNYNYMYMVARKTWPLCFTFCNFIWQIGTKVGMNQRYFIFSITS